MNTHNKNLILNNYISKLYIEFILIDNGLCIDWDRNEHYRMRDTVYLILDGCGTITINGVEYHPSKNSLVLIPQGSRVSFHTDPGNPYKKYWCDFLMTLNGVPFFSQFPHSNVVKLPSICRQKEIMKRLTELNLKTDMSSALMIKSLLLELVSIFFSDNNAEAEPEKNAFEENITKYITDHFPEKITVHDLAEMTGYNTKYFISLFKTHFGTTPAKYIRRIKIERAIHELLYTDDKCSVIARNTGYSSQRKFTEDFKQLKGLTPTEFRAKLKNKY